MSKKKSKKTETSKNDDHLKDEINQEVEDNSSVDELQLEKEKYLRPVSYTHLTLPTKA